MSRAEEDGIVNDPIHFYRYKPMYALVGHPLSKIQVSLKVNVVKKLPLYFGYSQLMMWDAFIAKPYFYDLNYNPEVFYRFALDGENTEWLDVGVEHESNGRGAAGERSWDRAYLRYHVLTRTGNDTKIHWEVKAWVPGDEDENNRDLAQYRGLWEVNITVSDILKHWFDKADLTLRLYPGGPSLTDPLRGGQELTFTARLGESSVLPVFVAQLFHGYGEDLRDYNVNHWEFRAGFGF